MANYQTITGELVRETSSPITGDKIVYSATVDPTNLRANIMFYYYEKGSTYAGLNKIYILNNGSELLSITNPNYPSGPSSDSWTLMSTGSTTVPYNNDGTLSLNLAITYKTNGTYPNELFDENGFRRSWITDTQTTVALPNLYSAKYKHNNTWKDANVWLKINGVWKNCMLWKKINGMWKKGS